MNVFEFSERYGITLRKSRKIAKDNPSWFNGDAEAADEIRAYLSKGVGITVAQLVDLIENPGWLLSLGKYADIAEKAISVLGDAKGQVAPVEVSACITGAAKGEPEAVQTMVDWLKTIIPEKPVSHAYIAVRLLLSVPESIRKYEGPRIPRALLNARNHPSFAGWWRLEKGVSKNKTVYQKLVLDL